MHCNPMEEQVFEGHHVQGLGEKRKRVLVLSLDFGCGSKSRLLNKGTRNANLERAI